MPPTLVPRQHAGAEAPRPCPRAWRFVIRCFVVIAAALTIVILWPVHSHAATGKHPPKPLAAGHLHYRLASTPEAYARQLAAHWYGWTGPEWSAVESIIRGPVHSGDGRRWGGESGWNACAVYPSQSICDYSGSNSCGIPQANPCPSQWRGDLAGSWRQQVRWLLWYVHRRFGSPSAALAHHDTYGSY